MTLFYQTKTWSNEPRDHDKAMEMYAQLADKKNWRIVQLINSFYQTEYQSIDSDEWIDVTRRKTLEEAEEAIDNTVSYYRKKIEFANGPKVIKTFK